MPVRDTSLEAYDDFRPRIGKLQSRVLTVLRGRRFCNKQIAKSLNLPINVVTPRVCELRQKGLVIDAGKGQHDGRTVHFWTAKNRYFG